MTQAPGGSSRVYRYEACLRRLTGGQTEQLQTRLPSDGPRAHQLAANH